MNPKWIWMLPALVAGVLAFLQADSLVFTATAWLFYFLPQFLVLGTLSAEKISGKSLVAGAIAAAVVACLLYWIAWQWDVWAWLIYLFLLPGVFAGAFAAAWCERRGAAWPGIARAAACAACVLVGAGLGYLWWGMQIIEF